ncbi:hypothetical protein JQ559_28365 [Bradyrhizobium viridifuturi]|jgi:hypothetical protein|nr:MULTISPECIES: hypothetical protein [Bradyrhizobium]ERF83396.1 MAG: hypothetical protein C207_03437 [Bradyrhizobium sp. DFCI-1]QRI68096.1 hypothetical protein JQ507_24580 [Bradyrhizobium sp. PSBB068]MBR1023035.1 hypothetical protein [Bradyrhizobium viridifuturi]MBR1040068.1 hypothetical protein [Bradyrhizobium viridifuturi]MBR1047579.1 hypothetical protein [Bradyrhizobium viridifuturi]
MTVNATEVEAVLGPLRGFHSYDNRMISLRSIGSPDNPFAPPELRKAWAATQWTDTGTAPVSDWLGNVEGSSSHAETIQRMRVAAFVAFTDMVPVLAADHPWCLLNHQAAGHACRQQRLVGRRVLLKPEVEFKCLEIATSYYNTQLGWDLPFLSDLMKYRSQLQEIGLDCNSSGTFKWLMEGFYPIDLSQPVIDQVCLQPFSLESLLGSPRPYGSIEHYAILVVIAPNSD